MLTLLLPESSIAEKFISCFVKTFIRVSKRKQKNVHGIFSDNTKQEIVGFHVGWHLMWYATADKIFASWKEVDGGLDLTHTLIEMSMDGLHVKWKTVTYL